MRYCAVDTETYTVAPGLLAPPLVCVSIAERTGSEVLEELYDRALGVMVVGALLRAPDVTLIFHNAAFDVAVLCEADPSLLPLFFKAYAEGRIRDTKIREELRDIADGRKQDNGVLLVHRDGEWVRPDYSLAGLVMRYLGRDRSAEKHGEDAWRMRYAELDGVPLGLWPQAAIDYAKQDAYDTLACFEAQGTVMPTEEVQVCAAWALHLMSAWGMRTDGEAVARLKAALLTEQAKNRRRMIQVGFLVKEKCSKKEIEDGKVEFYEETRIFKKVTKKEMKQELPPGAWAVLNPQVVVDGVLYWDKGTAAVPYRWKKDNKKIQEYTARVYKRQWKTAPTTKTGVSIDKDTLYESGSRLLKLVADGGGVDKLLQTYIPVLEQGANVPINARFNVLVNSGRTSCQRPNLQNMPAGRRAGQGEVRTCFVARAGYTFVSVDYSTLELVALAQICWSLFGQSRMREVINAGQDLHSAFAADMMGVSYGLVEKNKKTKGAPEKKARDAAKVGNFGLPGGLGAQSLQDYARTGYGIRLELDRCAELKREWMSAWPEMRLYFKYINDRVGMGGETLEHPLTGFIRGGVGYTDGCNHLFQHLAAYGAKKALFRVAYECYVDETSPLYGCRPVAFIHDEIIMEAPDEKLHEAASRLTAVMVAEMQTVLPDVKVSAEPAAMKKWWKEATDVYDSSGRLIPWEPLPSDEKKAA